MWLLAAPLPHLQAASHAGCLLLAQPSLLLESPYRKASCHVVFQIQCRLLPSESRGSCFLSFPLEVLQELIISLPLVQTRWGPCSHLAVNEGSGPRLETGPLEVVLKPAALDRCMPYAFFYFFFLALMLGDS